MIRRMAALVVVGVALVFSPLWASKDAYQRKIGRDLDEISAKIDRLGQRSQHAGEKTRGEIDEQIHLLRQKLEVARQRLQTLQSRSSGQLAPLRSAVTRAMDDLKRTYGKTAERFHERK
jgi:hypothetical protein